MRRLILVLLALTACTPRQEAAWLHWHRLDPTAAVEYLYDHGIADRPDEPDHPGEPDHWAPPADEPCGQWYDEALAAGWSDAEWHEPVARIMWAESRCNPNAYNGASGVAGLMQIHPLWRADAECAGNLYDPVTNLVCARHVYHVQGWQAWVTY
jgi:hypothetical protein